MAKVYLCDFCKDKITGDIWLLSFGSEVGPPQKNDLCNNCRNKLTGFLSSLKVTDKKS